MSETREIVRLIDTRNQGVDAYQIRYKDANNQNSINVQNAFVTCISLDWTQSKVSHIPTNLCLTGLASAAATLEIQFLLDSAIVFRTVRQDILAGNWTINVDFLMQAVNKGNHKLEVMVKVSAGAFAIDSGNANLYIQLTGLTNALRETTPKVNVTQIFTPVSIQFSATIGIAALNENVTAAIDTPIPISISEIFTGASISFSVEVGIAVLAENINIEVVQL